MSASDDPSVPVLLLGPDGLVEHASRDLMLRHHPARIRCPLAGEQRDAAVQVGTRPYRLLCRCLAGRTAVVLIPEDADARGLSVHGPDARRARPREAGCADPRRSRRDDPRALTGGFRTPRPGGIPHRSNVRGIRSTRISNQSRSKACFVSWPIPCTSGGPSRRKSSMRSSSIVCLLSLAACGGPAAAPAPSGGDTLAAIMQDRGLTDADVLAAAKTYTPSGKQDEYVLFASGGQSGNMLAIGVPSMRILKYIAVFGPESWQGYGYGGLGDKLLYDDSKQGGKEVTWGDVHHPNLSETNGDYDGKYLFINDKANARVAVIDLADFTTKQIVTNPLVMSDHGGAFVTPNTDYVVESSQYAAPLGGAYAPLDQYNDKYRGAAMFWKFDKAAGRIDKDKSWAIELPPYAQDLSDAGKLDSDGFVFINSWDTERASGTNGAGKPVMESGASQNDMDFLHVIDWKKAEKLVEAGKTTTINGVRVISLETAAAEHVLTFIPEPKSPHGCDVTPDGKAIVVGGKLDTHTTIYDFAKIKAQIEAGDYASTDPYGVGVLDFQKSIRGQKEIGLGPLHTVFDNTGHAYTSVFLDSTVVKWNWQDLDEPSEALSVQYNIGHIAAAEGDTVSPDGHWVVAMNKMAQDRYLGVGPLLPQNFQLIDISGEHMTLTYDLPIPLGEPHYAQMIKADKLHTLQAYTPAGTNPYTDQVDPGAVASGQERIERNGKQVDVYMSEIRSHFTPDTIEVNQGDEVTLHLTSLEQAYDQTHGFALDMYNINLSMEPGKYEEVHFVADRAGVFPFYCTEFCSALHLEMMGYLLVKPTGS
jgi:nitrous-oxide reductase